MDSTRCVKEQGNLVKEFLSSGLRCHIIYGVVDVEIILEWVYATMQRRRKLVITTQHPFIDFG